MTRWYWFRARTIDRCLSFNDRRVENGRRKAGKDRTSITVNSTSVSTLSPVCRGSLGTSRPGECRILLCIEEIDRRPRPFSSEPRRRENFVPAGRGVTRGPICTSLNYSAARWLQSRNLAFHVISADVCLAPRGTATISRIRLAVLTSVCGNESRADEGVKRY